MTLEGIKQRLEYALQARARAKASYRTNMSLRRFDTAQEDLFEIGCQSNIVDGCMAEIEKAKHTNTQQCI